MKRGLNKENSLPDPEFGGESSESARAIHYVVQKDTLMTYVSALIAQADPGIVSGSTIERKKMSTKTIYKRIALVAVAALGAGVLSVAPASADELPGSQVTAVTVATETTAPAVGSAVFVKFGATFAALTAAAGNSADSTQFRAAITAFPTGGSVAITSNTAAAATPAGTATPVAVTAGTAPTTAATASTNEVTVTLAAENTTAWSAQTLTYLAGFNFTPTKAGVYEVTVWRDTDDADDIDVSEIRNSVSITVAAAATYSSALSTMHSVTGNGTAAATSTTNAVALLATATRATATRAAITVTLRDSANATMASGNTLTAVMTGVGGFGSTTVTADTPGATDCSATTVERVKTLAADAVNTLTLCSDGNSGVGTVTVSITNAAGVTTVLGTKTITYYGTVATLSATVLQGIARPGAANGDKSQNAATQATLALTPAVVVVAKDANGVIVPGLTVVGTPTDLTIVASSTTDGAVNGTTDKNGPGYYNFDVTGGAAANVGKSTTVVYSTTLADGVSKISSAPVTIALAGTPAAVTWALDKTSYTPGEKVTITVTAKDAAGNNAADGTYANLFAGATVLGGQITGSTPAASVEIVGGKAAYTAFAPGSSGSYVISNTLAASAGAANVGKALTGTIVVGASADMAAITTLINSLVAKINALNKLVIKIQKKVRA
jgi:trimeric autotransporter adhesin